MPLGLSYLEPQRNLPYSLWYMDVKPYYHWRFRF